MKPEKWVAIKGYEGRYEVSNRGKVASIKFNNTSSRKIMKPFKTKKGYLQVELCNKGKTEKRYVHRLVAEAFIENPENLPLVNHINEIKSDNIEDNLEWCTVEYNNKYSRDRLKILGVAT